MDKKVLIILLIISISFFSFLGCAKKINSIEGLAVALKNEGIDYQLSEPLNKKIRYIKIDQMLALKGNGFNIEIFKIRDKKSFKQFVSSMLLVGAIKKKVGPIMNVSGIYVKKPFVILVREEPSDGAVKKALKKIFPKDKKDAE